jgi:hypothetical protein
MIDTKLNPSYNLFQPTVRVRVRVILQLPMESLPMWVRISLGEVYSIQRYVIECVSDLRQVSGFLRVLRFPPPIKLTSSLRYSWNIVEGDVKHHNPHITEILLKVANAVGPSWSDIHRPRINIQTESPPHKLWPLIIEGGKTRCDGILTCISGLGLGLWKERLWLIQFSKHSLQPQMNIIYNNQDRGLKRGRSDRVVFGSMQSVPITINVVNSNPTQVRYTRYNFMCNRRSGLHKGGYARVGTIWLRLFKMNRTNNFDLSL